MTVAIEVRDLSKEFRLPVHRIDSLKERALRPFGRTEYRRLGALREVSFDVHRGEFFSIVGRNGSGKSTLLKVLASIYRADAGRVRMAGRVAPFIELGVGFNPELSARENVVLNGVMMGLSRREAGRRLDAVLEFAELEEFVDMKLKNYSSGMQVRLAFSVMVQAEPEIMLVDEVLAVGDAEFQRKSGEAFRQMRAEGRTIVLVTHDMGAVEAFSDRAMWLNEGELRYVGEPHETGRRYFGDLFAGVEEPWKRSRRSAPDLHARLVEARLEDEPAGEHGAIQAGDPIRFEAVFEARRELVNPDFGFECRSAEGVTVFGFRRSLGSGDGPTARLAAGERARISGAIANSLAPGAYTLRCWVVRDTGEDSVALQCIDVISFDVRGESSGPGIVSVPAEVSVEAERGEAG